MSEQEKPVSFMQKLNAWSDANVVFPLVTDQTEEDWEEIAERVKKAIREKVLESYKNGLKAPRRPAAPAMAASRR